MAVRSTLGVAQLGFGGTQHQVYRGQHYIASFSTCRRGSQCTVVTSVRGTAAIEQGMDTGALRAIFGGSVCLVVVHYQIVVVPVDVFLSSTSAAMILSGNGARLCRGWTSHAQLDNNKNGSVAAAVVSCTSFVMTTILLDVLHDFCSALYMLVSDT